MEDNMRKQRKDEHIERLLQTEYQGNNLLSDVYVETNSLPGLADKDVDTSTIFLGQKVDFPLYINAMTGGTDLSEEINSDLAYIARTFNLPMAVGSQKIALEDEAARKSFHVVREVLGRPHTVIDNLGAEADEEMVREAMAMIEADAIGIHINVSQELAMAEGDKDFSRFEENIRRICQAFPGKVIAKEVGFGLSEVVGKKLVEAGVAAIDVSGYGGTNFVEIEDLRAFDFDYSEFYSWGIPTAKAILNVRRASEEVCLIASGGIKTASDIVKAIILGADMTAISGELLRFLLFGGRDYASKYVQDLILHTRNAMVMLGCTTIEDLKRVPYKLTGRLREIEMGEWKQV